MDHIEAVNSEAVEQYLLGQMRDTEIEEFEKHFFECPICAEEVESGILFQENARAAFASAPKPVEAKRKWIPTWWTTPAFATPALAAALLAVVVTYQTGFLIPSLREQVAHARAPQSLLAFALRPGTRGEASQENRVVIPAGTKSFVIQLDLTDTSFANYRCDLTSGPGQAILSIEGPAPPAGSPLNLWIPVGKLKPGAYTLTVRGVQGAVPGTEVASYPFVLQLQ